MDPAKILWYKFALRRLSRSSIYLSSTVESPPPIIAIGSNKVRIIVMESIPSKMSLEMATGFTELSVVICGEHGHRPIKKQLVASMMISQQLKAQYPSADTVSISASENWAK